MKRFLSGLIISSILVSGVPTYAANVSGQFELNSDSKITQTYGVSFDQTISNINNTIKAINEMKAKGQVSDAQIKELASQIYSLEKATMGITLSDKDVSNIATVLESAEQAVEGLSNSKDVDIAIMLSRTFYGIPGGKEAIAEYNESVGATKTEKKNNNSSSDNLAPLPVGYGTSVEGTTIKDSYTANNNYAAGSTAGQVKGTQLVNSFWDVKPTDWYYTQVQAMVQRGLFAGKGNVSEGVGTFAPNDTMTKAEFVTVVARMFYKDDEINNFSSNDSIWWDKYYNACVSSGIFSEGELKYSTMEQGMSREEMSFIAERALEKIEGKSSKSYNVSKAKEVIPDFSDVSNHLQTFVVKAYADGLLCGTDDKGTFAPKATLTRAEASTVLYRIVESDARTPHKELISNSNSTSSYQYAENTSSPITIKEGEVSLRRLAKEGDTVIKADGTTVVLKKGAHGILGEGQGVAPDLGATSISGMPSTYTVHSFNDTTMHFQTAIYFEDSTGMSVSNQGYYINALTGEGHWGSEWKVIEDATEPTVDGSFHLKLSENKAWYWDANMNEWAAVRIQHWSSSFAQQVLQANGL